MLEDTEEFVAWEERIISQERGNRVVHFYLRDSSGNYVLAVEGTERSIRHMVYVVSDKFIEHYGDLTDIDAGTKWRARREVVEWLTTLVPNQQSHLEFSAWGRVQPTHDLISGPSGDLTLQVPEMFPRKLKAQVSGIVWQGMGWTCSKQLMHYPAFRRNGTTIRVHSFVFIMAVEGSHYLGYLEDLYEDKKGQKKVKVRWFHRDEEVPGVVSLSQLRAHPREVFITPQVQVISAECISGPAIVLTPKHYEQCMSVIPHAVLSRVHLCFRQLKNKKIKPFTLKKLQGYCKQAVLSCLDHPLFSKNETKGQKRKRLDEGSDEEFRVRNRIRVGSKQNRPEKSPSALGSRIRKVVPSYPKLKIKLSGRTLSHGKFVGSRHKLSSPFRINDEIELLSQDSGMRGCWFRCKVLQVAEKSVKVQYDDVQDAENSGNLQEWVASQRVAAPDKLGMRCSGRLTTRPRPPKDSADFVVEVGAPVDVWWCDGWWEAIVIATNALETGHLKVYLPGEDRYMSVEKLHVRAARDWVNGSWVDAKMKPDILSNITANASLTRPDNAAMPPISELEEVEERENLTLNESGMSVQVPISCGILQC